MKILYSSFIILVFAFIAIAQAEFVYGDPATKMYYGMRCQEMHKIEAGKAIGFKSPTHAEKAGFTRGEKCTERQPQISPSADWKPEKPKRSYGDSITVRELRKGVLTLEEMGLNIEKYIGGTTKFVGDISITSVAGFKQYETYDTDHWAFLLNDGTDSGYFLMHKGQHSDQIRKFLSDRTRDYDVIWTCTVKPMGIYAGSVWGLLSQCEFRILQ